MEENIGYYYQQIFKKIFNISAMILEEYHNLETKNIDSNSLNKLKNLLTQEQEYYKMIKTNPDLLNGLLHKIAYFNKKTVDFIIPKNPNSLIYARISLKLSDLVNPNKSPEIFIVFNKFDLFSLIHYENILLALIFF